MPTASRITRRLVVVGVCVLSLLVCCGLAWWQWERYSAAGGSAQNLGYVLQWPLFGLFPAFVFWRVRKLGKSAGARSDGRATDTAVRRPVSAPIAASRAQAARAAVDRRAHEEEDAELAAYNRYLAELHARDQRRS